jgi:hypothetical protein
VAGFLNELNLNIFDFFVFNAEMEVSHANENSLQHGCLPGFDRRDNAIKRKSTGKGPHTDGDR